MLRRIGIVALFVLFSNLFFFRAFGPVAFVLYTSAFFIILVSLFLTNSFWKNYKTTLIVSTFLLGLFDLLLISRDYWLVQLLQVAGILTIGASMMYLLSTDIPFFRSLLELTLTPFHLGLTYLYSCFSFLTKLLSIQTISLKERKHKTPWLSLIIGLAAGLPIVFILVQLFSSADPIYALFVKKLFTFKISDQLLGHIIFSVVIFVILIPLLFFKRQKEFNSPLAFINRFNIEREMAVVMTLVAVTLASFLIVQAPYIFVRVAAETDLSKFGLSTYSEYVKKGFGELIVISSILYGLVWSGLIVLRNLKNNKQSYLKTIQLIILIEFGIFIFSIFRRIWLYQQFHGLTLVRIYGSVFLIWITAITITLFARHFWKKRFVLAEVGITMLLLIAVGIFNAEDFIAKYNPPHVNSRIDYVYLSRLSFDGYEGWKKAYAFAEEVLVSRNLQDQQLINREDRRDVAYAGIILGNVISNYHELTIKYGTQKDVQNYQTSILNSFIAEVTAYQNQLAGNLIASGNTLAETQLAQKVSQELAEKHKRLLVSSTTKDSSFSVSPNFYHYENIFSLTVNPYCINHSFQYGLCIESFYRFDGRYLLPAQFQLNTRDYVFTWNGSNQAAYEKFTKEITVDQLLSLQKHYFELYHKIIMQPKEERDYDIDISFDTPFL